jgi:hypothetical protein
MTTTKTKDTQWYAAKTGNHQGLVIEEGTGRSVAVAYDKSDAPLLAAAPKLLSALQRLTAAVMAHRESLTTDNLIELADAEDNARAALAATEVKP